LFGWTCCTPGAPAEGSLHGPMIGRGFAAGGRRKGLGPKLRPYRPEGGDAGPQLGPAGTDCEDGVPSGGGARNGPQKRAGSRRSGRGTGRRASRRGRQDGGRGKAREGLRYQCQGRGGACRGRKVAHGKMKGPGVGTARPRGVMRGGLEIQMNSLMMFSSNSWRPLMLGAASPFFNMIASSLRKFILPASISAPSPLSQEE